MMVLKIICASSILVSTTICFSLENDVQILESQVADCLASIARRYFPQEALILVQTPENECEYTDVNYVDSFLQVLVKEMNYQMMILGCAQYKLNTTKLKSAVLVLVMEERDDVETYLRDCFVSYAMVRIFTRYELYVLRVVIVSTIVPNSIQQQEEIALTLLKEAWFFLANLEIILLMPEVGWSTSTNKTPDVDIYSWNPVEQSEPCFRELDRVSCIDRWISVDKEFERNEDLYPYKGFVNDLTCTLHVQPKIIPPYFIIEEDHKKILNPIGIYPTIWKMISSTINIDIQYHSSFENLKYVDVEAPVLIRKNKLDSLPLSYPYFRTVINCYVPLIGIERWQGPIRVFTGLVWGLVGIVFLLGSMTLWILEKYILKKHVSLTDSFLKSLRSYVAVGIPFDCKGLLSTSFFILWLFYCMQIYTAYTSLLTSFLTFPGEYPLVSSMKDLNDTTFEVWIVFRYLDSINEIEDNFMTYPICKSKEDCMEKLVHDQDIAVIADESFYDARFDKKYSEHGRSRIFRLNDPVMEYYVTARFQYMRVFEYFEKHMQWLVSSGITARIIQKYRSRYEFNTPDQHDLNDPKSMTLSEFQGPFYFLVGGLVTSFIVLICENIYSKKYDVLLYLIIQYTRY
ncbi:Ionotropic receptor 561 [Blattella germanica]|nr:Ionotropic receptor 561 [Blattella germanica]